MGRRPAKLVERLHFAGRRRNLTHVVSQWPVEADVGSLSSGCHRLPQQAECQLGFARTCCALHPDDATRGMDAQ